MSAASSLGVSFGVGARKSMCFEGEEDVEFGGYRMLKRR